MTGAMFVGTLALLAERGHAMGDDEETVVTTYAVYNNHIGAPIMMADTDGAAVWSTWHDPFGQTINLNEDVDGDGEAITLNVRFPGQYYDAETGLHYNWHRYYDPEIGRYLQPDVYPLITYPNYIGERMINGFMYANNNPFVFYDYSGFSCLRDIMLGVSAGIIGGGLVIIAGAPSVTIAAVALGAASIGMVSVSFIDPAIQFWGSSPYIDACNSCINGAKLEYHNLCEDMNPNNHLPEKNCYWAAVAKVTCKDKSQGDHAAKKCAKYCGAAIDAIPSAYQ